MKELLLVKESAHLRKLILCKEQSTMNKLNFFELLSVLLKHFSMKKLAETRKFRALHKILITHFELEIKVKIVTPSKHYLCRVNQNYEIIVL
jgi:hypothetical protein